MQENAETCKNMQEHAKNIQKQLFWFKPFLARALCCLCTRRVLFVFCSLVRRRSMPRRGWSSLPVPDGWFEDLPPCSGPTNRAGKAKVAPTAAPRGRWRNPDRATRAPAQTRGDPPTQHVVLRKRSSLPLRREFRSWNELSKCWERILDPSSRCSRTL